MMISKDDLKPEGPTLTGNKKLLKMTVVIITYVARYYNLCTFVYLSLYFIFIIYAFSTKVMAK